MNNNRKPNNYQRNRDQKNPIRRKVCLFCKKKVDEIDYKNTQVLGHFLSNWSKIRPSANSGVCRKHQRSLGLAIKRARFLGLLPYVTR